MRYRQAKATKRGGTSDEESERPVVPRSGGTDPRDPAEGRGCRRAAEYGTAGGNDDGDTELRNHLNETRADSEAGEAVARRWRSRRSPTTSTSTGYERRTGARARTGPRAWTDRRADEYASNLEGNLQSLLDRAKSGTYRAPPVRRVHIPKGIGSETRPIGIPTFEDKVLQRAVAMVLEAVYEQDFLDCSYGFRPGRSAHQALDALRQRDDEMRWRLGPGGRHREILRHPGPRATCRQFFARGYVTACCCD